MNNIRLFFPKSLSINFESELDKPQSHYLIKVMRLKIDNNFLLFNETGEWVAKIIKIVKNKVYFKIKNKFREKTKEKEVWLAFTPIKLNNLNFLIQKSTELGVTKFMPIISERTIVRKVNLDRIRKIIIEASEQSNRINIPKLEEPISLENFLKKNSDLNIVFGDLNTNNKKIKSNLDKVCILIGPEGDFSETERQKILKLKNVQTLKLNRNILRSETAALTAISIISYFLNL